MGIEHGTLEVKGEWSDHHTTVNIRLDRSRKFLYHHRYIYHHFIDYAYRV